MGESRWFRNDVDWWEQEWILSLSSEAKHCYNLLLCRIGAVGQHGRAKKTPPLSLSRQWFVGEESVRQMLIAAVASGMILDDGEYWEVPDPSVYAKDPGATERKRAQRARQKEEARHGMSRDVTDVTDVTVQDKTVQYKTDPPIVPPRGKRTVFVKPSADECAGYAKEIGLAMQEARKFFDHYTSNGWKVGKAGMSDWRAAMRNWKARVDERPGSGGERKRPPRLGEDAA